MSGDENKTLKLRISYLEAQLASARHELHKKKEILKNKYHHNERDDEDDALFQAILDTFGSNGNPTKSLHTPTSTYADLSFPGTHARTNTLIKRQKDEKDEQILTEIWRKVCCVFFDVCFFWLSCFIILLCYCLYLSNNVLLSVYFCIYIWISNLLIYNLHHWHN